MWRRLVMWLGCLALCGACAAEDPASPSVSGPLARFDAVAEGTIPWSHIPFPHDLYLGADGTVDLPLLAPDTPLWRDVRELLDSRRGFCLSCAVHFPFDGEVDRASLGADAAVGAEALASDPLLLLDVDPASPERGSLVPLRVELDDAEGLITVRPARGWVLTPRRTYAAVMTSQLRGPQGAAMRPAADFAAARDGGTGAVAARLSPILEPAFEVLEEVGVARSTVVSLAVFTTDEPYEHVAATAALVDAHFAASPAVATVDHVWRADDGSLDTLLGTPAPGSKPGMDAAPAVGVEGSRAVAHASTSLLVAGRFMAPRLLTGSGSEVGELRRDDGGALELGPSEEVPFLLTIPTGADPSVLPVVVVHWGIGGRRQNALAFADTLGAAGFAVLGIDAYQHGARALSAKDEGHDLRGDDGLLGPDGLHEVSSLSVSTRVLGIEGVDAELAGSPRFGLAALSQLSADLLSTLHLVRSGDLSALAAVDPTLAGLAFDPDGLMLIGESLGTIPATAVLTLDSGVVAAVLGVAPGSLVDIFCESPVYRALAKLALLPRLDFDRDLDEVNQRLSMQPALNLYRWAIEGVEPQVLAPRLFAAPGASGPRPDVLWQFGDLDESLGTGAPDALIAVLGVPAVGDFPLASVAGGSAPMSANTSTPQGTVTAGAWRFEQAGHGMLGTMAQSSGYLPPIIPPFTTRSPDLDFDNPTDLTHAQIRAFFAARLANGSAAIVAP